MTTSGPAPELRASHASTDTIKVPKTVLLADGSVTIQRVVELTFATEDVKVIAVGDGNRAIEVIDRSRPDVVLADIGMPRGNGYELADYMRRQPRLAAVPILLLHGAFEAVDLARVQAVGADGVLTKPFDPAVLDRAGERTSGLRAEWAPCRAGGRFGHDAIGRSRPALDAGSRPRR